MNQPFGPYRLTAGLHEEDCPTGVRLKVKEVGNGFVVDSSGAKRQVVRNGSHVMHDGRQHTCYRGQRKVMPGELQPGDEVELAEQRTFGPCRPKLGRDGSPEGWEPDVSGPSLIQPGVRYEPFMSMTELDGVGKGKPNLNKPNAIKFVRDLGQAQVDEIAQLKRANAELLERLARAESPKGEGQQQSKKSA